MVPASPTTSTAWYDNYDPDSTATTVAPWPYEFVRFRTCYSATPNLVVVEERPETPEERRARQVLTWSKQAIARARTAHRSARPRIPQTARLGTLEAFSGRVGAIHGRWRVRR